MSASTAIGHPASARTVLAALDSGAVKLLVIGGIGSGKSTALEVVRRNLRESGRTVVSRVPDEGGAGTVVVIDDAHLLTASDLRRLTELADDPDCTVVVASEARDHDPALNGLGSVLEREHPRITLGPLPTGEVARTLADPSGHPLASDLIEATIAVTGGVPLLVSAIGAAARPLTPATMAQAVGYTLNDRLRRLDPADLETLLITSLSADLGAADVAAALDLPAGGAAELVDRVRGTGLVEPSLSEALQRTVHRAAAMIIGAARHHEVESALLRTQLKSATLSDHLALQLAEHGIRDDALTAWLREHAASGRTDAAGRIRWYRAAVDAGAIELRARLADTLALSGECRSAATLADVLLDAPDATERAAGTRVAASIAAHDGNTAYAAELFSWLGAYPDTTVGSAAALVHTAAGDLAAARAALTAACSGPPTTVARSARSLAEGLLLTVDGRYSTAAARLGQAVAGEQCAAPFVLPDSAAAVVTLAALHSGDSGRARSVIGRAVRDGGDPASTARHRLLQGWVRMQEGQLVAASADANAVDGLHGRDALWAAALRTAIARRGGDSGSLTTNWFAGMDVLAEYSVDLFSLLPLGELWVAAARLRQQDRLAPALDQAFTVLGGLGDPPAWSAPLHWAGVHAGILAGDPAAVAPHGQALTAMAGHSTFAAALAAAGRTWLQVLAGQVDPDEVIAAARGLAGFGLTSDATRLAGQAALQAADPKVSALMLQMARDLKLGTGESPVDPDEMQRAIRPRPAVTALSDREREVAELLLLGMPYRDIGAQLFISAKTVEHHVARIRRRLGAESRSEMLSMLRVMLSSSA
jgi:DNA-binding NarL/FixJ family response regulator